jgi:hypothetical protein
VTSAVAQVVVQTVVPLTDGLAGYWKLDETSGTVAADSSGGGHDGVVIVILAIEQHTGAVVSGPDIIRAGSCSRTHPRSS